MGIEQSQETFAPAKLMPSMEEPVCAPVAGGTSLLCLSNTERELCRRKATGAFDLFVADLGLRTRGET